MRSFLFVTSFLMVAVVAASCGKLDFFEKNTPVKNSTWYRADSATGTFNIDDTLSAFNLYVVVRHKDSYRYNNIWLNVGMQIPGAGMQYQKVDLLLGTDEKWLGIGMNDIWEVRKPLTDRPMRFARTGQYRYSIKHIMRDDPLPGVMSVGFRVEKSGP